jgi:hypothetical protein
MVFRFITVILPVNLYAASRTLYIIKSFRTDVRLTFLCAAKEKSAKERPPATCPSGALRFSPAKGSTEGPSMALRLERASMRVPFGRFPSLAAMLGCVDGIFGFTAASRPGAITESFEYIRCAVKSRVVR